MSLKHPKRSQRIGCYLNKNGLSVQAEFLNRSRRHNEWKYIYIYLSLFIYMYIFIYLFICTYVFYSANQFFKAGHPSKSAHAQVQGNSSDELSWNFPQMISIFGDSGPVFLNDLFRLVKHPNWIVHVCGVFRSSCYSPTFFEGLIPILTIIFVSLWDGKGPSLTRRERERQRAVQTCIIMHPNM